MNDYELLDSGDGEKLERFGSYLLQRPSSSALWHRKKQIKPDLLFTRKEGWKGSPSEWVITLEGVKLKVKLTDFGHLGVFPEHLFLWKELKPFFQRGFSFLNLFGYTGGASLFAAKEGASVCHVDASRPSVLWAKENALLNGIDSIRWIVDDVMKFLKREEKRGVFYDGILLDPPSFGRGAKQEVFKIEDAIQKLLLSCKKVLSLKAAFVAFSCHTPILTPTVISQLLEETLGKGFIKSGELLLQSESFSLPSGTYAIWRKR